MQHVNAGRKLLQVIGEILSDLRFNVKTDDKGLVGFLPEGLLQKRDGRVLLEREAIVHRLAGIDQQADLQGKIRFALKAEDLLRRLVVVKNLEIVLLQVLDVVVVLVGDGEDQVDFAHRRA